MIVFALRLEEDGRRVYSRTWITHFAPEVRDRITAVTFARSQTQTTRATGCRTRFVCSKIIQSDCLFTALVKGTHKLTTVTSGHLGAMKNDEQNRMAVKLA